MKTTRQKRTKEEAAFDRGYIIACCNIANMHDQPTIAADALLQLGRTKAQIQRDVDTEYDRKALRCIFRDTRWKGA